MASPLLNVELAIARTKLLDANAALDRLAIERQQLYARIDAIDLDEASWRAARDNAEAEVARLSPMRTSEQERE